jgi:cob(I)alamin adenosyltransferase
VRKSGIRVEAYGTADELNSILGLVRAHGLPESADRWLVDVQNDLFCLGADLATPMEAKSAWIVRLEMAAVTRLEQVIDQIEAELPPLKNFILPGGAPAAAVLHVARTVCRRAERIAVQLNDEQEINPTVLIYLNRLSDLLFVLARWVNIRLGQSETEWQSGGRPDPA